MLVVLHNCGHLLGARASLLTTLCGATSKLRVVTTCPEAIGLSAELIWCVTRLSATDAVEMFAERADVATPGFRITGDNRPVIDQACRRLAGIPGAIEVAAARTNAMSLPEMRDSILDWFRGRSPVVLMERCATSTSCLPQCRGPICLCRDPARALLRSLAVFRGAFSLDAARSIGADHPAEDIDKSLSELVAHRLVEVEELSDAIRYLTRLETVREYASAKLSDSGEADTVRKRHWRHYTTSARLLPERTPRHLTTCDASDCANLLAATEWKRQAPGLTVVRFAGTRRDKQRCVTFAIHCLHRPSPPRRARSPKASSAAMTSGERRTRLRGPELVSMMTPASDKGSR